MAGRGRETSSAKTKKLAICSALAALGVVTLTVGSLFGVLDISMAVIASLFAIIAVIEYGRSAPWLVFAVTSVLSLIIMPQNTSAWMYVLFFGYYAILKEKLERRGKVLSWILKEVIFNVALALMFVAAKLILYKNTSEPLIIYILLAVLCELVFPIYDIALTRLISMYVYKIRTRFRFK